MGMLLPGMPGYQNASNSTSDQQCITIYTYYPNGCENAASTQIVTSNIIYNGPNLPNSGIQTGDTLSVILEKIDAAL